MMRHILIIHMMVFVIDLHLELKLIVVKYMLEIVYNFVYATNHVVMQNIGIIITMRIIVSIAFQGQYLNKTFKSSFFFSFR